MVQRRLADKGRSVMEVLALTAVWFLAFGAVYAGIVDIVIYSLKMPSHTVSEHIWLIITEYPVVAFVAGMIAGHLVWGQRPHPPKN